MVLKQFPDLGWLRRESERRFAGGRNAAGDKLPHGGWPNVVLNVKSGAVHRDNIRGPLSIFANISGDSSVELQKKHYRIREGYFFVTNKDQHYTLAIDKKAETSNIHFGDNFAEQVLGALRSSPQYLLDNPYKDSDPVALSNTLLPKTARLESLFREIASIQTGDMVLEEKLFECMSELLTIKSDDRKKLSSVPVVRKATREEIIKRIENSRDLIYSCYDSELSLDDLASASCLSKFHYLRLFRIAFGKTPHQFLNEVRIQRAKELLLK
jgi:AraC family transcriptional regulator